MPYASCLVSCSVVGFVPSRQLACPVVLCLMQLSLPSGTLLGAWEELCFSEDLGFCSLFFLRHIHIALWDSLSGLVHSGIACLAPRPLIGQLLSGMACLACD